MKCGIKEGNPDNSLCMAKRQAAFPSAANQLNEYVFTGHTAHFIDQATNR
jgi:hypothetical protein